MLESLPAADPGTLHPVRAASDIEAAMAVTAVVINSLCSLKCIFLHSPARDRFLSCIPIQNDYNKQITNSSVVYRTIYGKETLTREEYKRHGKFGHNTFLRHFGGWNEALKLCGITANAQQCAGAQGGGITMHKLQMSNCWMI